MPKILPYEKVKFKSEEEWLQLRATGIGGSDVSAIMGLNKYKTAKDVWQEKILGYKRQENEKMLFGRLLENVVAKEFERRYPTIKILPKPNYILRSKKYPHLIASIDYFIKEEGKMGVLEIKTTSSFVYRSWEYGLPLSYYLQLQHYLLVSGLEFGYIAVLINGQQLEKLKFQKDEETINEIIEKTTDFWERYILTKTEPPVEINEVIQTEGAMEADIKILDLYNQIVELEASKSNIEEMIEEKKNMIRELIKDKEVITRDGIPIIYNKVVNRVVFDTNKFKSDNPILYEQYLKTSSYNQLKIIKEN